MHWTLVTSVVVLTVTGLYIADPFIIGGTGPATGFTMGMIRAVHLATGGCSRPSCLLVSRGHSEAIHGPGGTSSSRSIVTVASCSARLSATTCTPEQSRRR